LAASHFFFEENTMATKAKRKTAKRKPPSRGQTFTTEAAEAFLLDPAQKTLLEICGNAIDELDRLEGLIRKQGDVVRDRFGSPQRHPAASARTEARRMIVECLDRLALGRPNGPPRKPDPEPPAEEEEDPQDFDEEEGEDETC
jgi:hypothetical protein